MNRLLALLSLALSATPSPAADPAPLTPQQLADGWVKLFDGESTFGWPKGATVEDGKLVFVAPADRPLLVPLSITHRGEFSIRYSAKSPPPADRNMVVFFIDHIDDQRSRWQNVLPDTDGDKFSDVTFSMPRPRTDMNLTPEISVPAGGRLTIAYLDFRPVGAKPLFDGKTLDGWKVFADPKRARSKFEVTAEGELKVTDGPGDLQSTTTHGDFLLSFDCKTRGKNLNSGVFFRCMPGEYQNGYEAQVQNAFAGTDRTKPVDFGTGAIYRRVPARKVVSNDNEWFTMTVLAVGPAIRTWVNGEPVVNWTDDRPKDDNPRKGLRTAAGHLSIQGHDPTTDILFKNIKVLDIK